MARTLLLSLFLIGRIGWAHEGHAIPGALPPAPHGGMVQEAAHAEEGHDHEHEGEGKEEHHEEKPGEVEVFYEAVFKNNEVRVYPLILGTATFAKMPVEKLSQISLSVDFPRQKRHESLSAAVKEGAIVAKLDPRSAYRFIVNVSAVHDGEPKAAKIQIERD